MLGVKSSISSSPIARRLGAYRPVSSRRVVHAVPRVKVFRATTESQDPTGDAAAKFAEKATEVSKVVQAKWEQTEDKPAAIIVATAALVALYALSSVVDAIDKIPVFSTLLELIGLIVSGWLGFRLVTAEADRKELLSTVDQFVEKVTGKKQ